VELIGLVAGWQGHAVQLGDVPSFDDMAAAAGIGAQGLHQIGHLVDSLRRLAERSVVLRLVDRPVDPLLAIDRAEIAPLRGKGGVGHDPVGKGLAGDRLAGLGPIAGERPIRPDLHPLGAERADVGIASQEPQEFARGGFPVDPLGGQQRHLAARQVEPQFGPEDGARAHPSPVDPLVALRPDAAHQVEVLPFIVRAGRIGGAVGA
jgi:hypothetical protein